MLARMGRPSDGYAGQTYMVEFTVSGELDGTTVQPPEIQAPSPPPRDPQSIYRFEVENLGLIDVDYVVSALGDDRLGARGNRWIGVTWISAGSAGMLGASLDVVDAVDGSVEFQKQIEDLAGDTRYYNDLGYLVPQGSMLRVRGFGPGPHKVRLHIQYLNDQELLQAQQVACCVEKPVPVENGSCLSRYAVSTPDYNCPFNSVQAAIDAAVADGFGGLDGATIPILPGVYFEDVTMPSGINLLGWAPEASGGSGAVIVGSVTYTSAVAEGDGIIEGLTIVGDGTSPALSFSGTEQQSLRVTDCLLVADAPGFDTVVNTNTNSESDLRIERTQVLAEVGNVAISSVASSTVTLDKTDTFHVDTAGVAIFVNGAGEMTVLGECIINGQVEVDSPGSLTIIGALLQTGDAANVANEGSVALIDVMLSNEYTGTYGIEGSGSFTYGDLTWSQFTGTQRIAPTLNGGSGASFRSLYEQDGDNSRFVTANSFVESDDEVLLVDTSGGDVTLTLHPSSFYRRGKVITIKKISPDSSNVFILTTGGELIDGFTTGLQTDIFRESLGIAADGINGFWLVYEGIQQFEIDFSFHTLAALNPVTYWGGFYLFGATDNGGVAVPLGAANNSYGAHAGIVIGGSPVGPETVTVSGTSVTNQGVKTPADSEVLNIPAGAPVNSYFQTTRKWVGTVTFTPSGGAPNFNYLLVCAFNGNTTNFIVRDIETSWIAAGGDADPDILLRHHRFSGWVYNAASPPLTPGPITTLRSTYTPPDNAFVLGEPGCWQITDLGVVVFGNEGEGIFLELNTDAEVLGNALVRLEQ